MKRKLFAMLALMMVFTMFLSLPVAANTHQQTRLYDASGNEVFGGRVYYDENSTPVFGPGCWYYYDDVKTDAYGMEAYRYDDDGNLIAAPYGSWCWGMGGGRSRGGCKSRWGW